MKTELESTAAAAQYLVDDLEQLAGVAEDLRHSGNDPEALQNRGVARLQRLHNDLADLRQCLTDDVTAALSSGYPDLVEWGGKAGRSYCTIALAIGEDLYNRVTLCLSSPPADAGAVDETALRAVWPRIMGVLDELADRVPWRSVDDLRARVTAEIDRAVVPVATVPAGDVAHSPRFRSVRWFGETYSFTASQALVVRLLYENWEAGTPDVADETLLQAIDLTAPPERLSSFFRDHPAWKTAIISGGSKGSHRLTELLERKTETCT